MARASSRPCDWQAPRIFRRLLLSTAAFQLSWHTSAAATRLSIEKEQQLFHTFVTVDEHHARSGLAHCVLTGTLQRPDIKAPRWTVKVHDQGAVSPGYWFTSPYEMIGQVEPGEAWIGPHIYDQSGELVWSGASMFNHLSVMDFRVSQIDGRDVLTLIRPEKDSIYLVDHSFRVVASQHLPHLNMHEFQVTSDGTRALLLREERREATAAMGEKIGLNGAQRCHVLFQAFQELDLTSPAWNETFYWTAFGEVGLEESSFTFGEPTDRCAGYWDYLHSNSVDKCDDGGYLLSARHTDTIYKISAAGAIEWRLGGAKSDFVGDLKFSRQHDVRFRGQNSTHTIITFLDNAQGEEKQATTSPFSRGLVVALRTDVRPMTAEILQQFDHPKMEHSFRRGNMQILPNNNVFVAWSEQGLQSEYTPDGRMIMEAQMLPEFLGTYRSYKFPFTGKPHDPPDVYAGAYNADADGSTGTLIFASWNGATEVKSWNVYRTTHDGRSAELVAWAQRTGFETAMQYDGHAGHVFVEALDARGQVIGRSDVFKTVLPERAVSKEIAEDVRWQQSQAARWPAERPESVRFEALFLQGMCISIAVVLGAWLARRLCLRREKGGYDLSV